MKRLSFLSILILIMGSDLSAQYDRGFIGISLGAGIPMGTFASTDFDDDEAGFANGGAVFQIDFQYKLGQGNYGFTAKLFGDALAVDAQAIADEFARQIPGVLWQVESSGWSVGGLMVGGFYAFSIGEASSFEVKTLFGYFSASTPDLTITGTSPGNSMWVKESAENALSLAYGFGLGGRIGLGERRTILLVDLDYLGGKPKFEGVQTVTSDGDIWIDSWSQNIQIVNITVGIAWKI